MTSITLIIAKLCIVLLWPVIFFILALDTKKGLTDMKIMARYRERWHFFTLVYWIIPFALSIGVYGQSSLLSNSRTEVLELLDPSLKTFSKYSHISRSSTSVGECLDIYLKSSLDSITALLITSFIASSSKIKWLCSIFFYNSSPLYFYFLLEEFHQVHQIEHFSLFAIP